MAREYKQFQPQTHVVRLEASHAAGSKPKVGPCPATNLRRFVFRRPSASNWGNPNLFLTHVSGEEPWLNHQCYCSTRSLYHSHQLLDGLSLSKPFIYQKNTNSTNWLRIVIDLTPCPEPYLPGCWSWHCQTAPGGPRCIPPWKLLQFRERRCLKIRYLEKKRVVIDRSCSLYPKQSFRSIGVYL